jgi:glycosyltransferase involved in cell wall biosynthesis
MAQDGHRVFCYAPGAFHGGKADIAENVTVLSSDFGDDRWGNKTLNYHLLWTEPDVVITWLDCQGLFNYGWTEHPTIMWAPVDAWPVPAQELGILGKASRLLVPSQWGGGVLEAQGVEADYVPCGIDLTLYNIDPAGRKRWRGQMQPSITDETFLIGSVGLNTGMPDRKGYGYQFDAIKKFAADKSDVRVYIHTNVEGDGGAMNLVELRRELGMEDLVAFSRPLGPLGESDLYMRDAYNAFDVLMHCGISEGFGIPLVEAQACGTPVVANACTSMTELLGPDSYPCDPLGDMLVTTCTRVAIPSVENLVVGLESAYADWKAGKHNRDRIRESVMRFEQDAIYENYWRPVLAAVPPKLDYSAKTKNLMLAAGHDRKEGYKHHDRLKFADDLDYAHDLEEFPWPWADDEWEVVEFSDCLEHLRADIVRVMDELWRITAPGGYVYIHTAEAGTWQLQLDPTHVRGFMLNSLDYFDPDTQYGQTYTYSERKWKIVKKGIDDAGLVFILQPRKGAGTKSVEKETVTA